MIEGGTGAQGHHGEVVGTSVVGGRHGQIAQIAVVFGDAVLDGGTLAVDELEDLFGSGAGLGVGLVGTHVGGEEGHTAILTQQQEVEVGTGPAGFPLVVVVLIHLGFVVLVEDVVFELKSGELVEEQVAVVDAVVAGGPQRAVGVGGAPCTVVEALDGVAVVRVDRLVGGRAEHGAAVVAEVAVQVGVDGGEESSGTLKLRLHVLSVVDTVLLVVHLLGTGRDQRQRQQSTENIFRFHHYRHRVINYYHLDFFYLLVTY